MDLPFNFSIATVKNFQTFLLQPFLAANNVRLIGVGPEEFGVKAFIEGKFLDGGKVLIKISIEFTIITVSLFLLKI